MDALAEDPRQLPVRGRARLLRTLPLRQGAWVVAQSGLMTALALGGLWQSDPSLVLSLSLGVGASVVHPSRLWALPLTTAAVTATGLVFEALRLPAVVGAGLAAGAVAGLLLPIPSDRVSVLQSALAGSASASLTLALAAWLLPSGTSSVLAAALIGLAVGAAASLSLLPTALQFDPEALPSVRRVRRLLRLEYRRPVLVAFDLFHSALPRAPDQDTRVGLQEVARWVLRLQLSLQTLDEAIREIEPAEIRARIQAYDEELADDAFTQERRRATVKHLKRLLEHHDTMRQERLRIASLVDYALAYLEEARAGLSVALTLPGEFTPERLHEVLGKLRAHATEGRVRRESAREVVSLSE
ncbi:MAG: hypothetical protein JXX28_00925 [Deltaproteobacteria bacterium]|nr:hypothetical protein [Deltaproteobacteria bacterium]